VAYFPSGYFPSAYFTGKYYGESTALAPGAGRRRIVKAPPRRPLVEKAKLDVVSYSSFILRPRYSVRAVFSALAVGMVAVTAIRKTVLRIAGRGSFVNRPALELRNELEELWLLGIVPELSEERDDAWLL